MVVQSYSFDADYRDLLNCLFTADEFGLHGQRIRTVRDSTGSILRECWIGDGTCIGHTACLTTTVAVRLGENYENRQTHSVFADGKRQDYDVFTGFGMVISIDQKKRGECEASLWMETDPLEWLRQRITPSPIRLEEQDTPSGKMEQCRSTFPGDTAMEFCQRVWQKIIDEWEALQSGGKAAEPEPAASAKPSGAIEVTVSVAKDSGSGMTVSPEVIKLSTARHNRRVAIWNLVAVSARAGETGKYIHDHLKTDKDGKKPCNYETLLDVIKQGLHGDLEHTIN